MKLKLDYTEQKWGKENTFQQSPINIETADLEKRIIRLTFDFNETVEATIQDDFNSYIFGSGLVTLNKKMFNFQQFHIHTPSEHQINGQFMTGELHLVHSNEYGELMVIAIFLKQGKENKALTQLIEQKGSKIDIYQLIPKKISGYKYTGSLTTPPLTNDVTWVVLDEPIEISKEQIKLYQKDYPKNNRKVQPLQDREIIEF